MYIDKITLVFENCEFMEIPGEELTRLCFGRIHKNANGWNLGTGKGIFDETEICDECCIGIKKEFADTDKINRLKLCDITSVKISTDDKDYEYRMPWYYPTISEDGMVDEDPTFIENGELHYCRYTNRWQKNTEKTDAVQIEVKKGIE